MDTTDSSDIICIVSMWGELQLRMKSFQTLMSARFDREVLLISREFVKEENLG